MTMPLANQSAPDFTLHDQDGVLRTLSQYRGSSVLLYFYPKDDTPGCTKEACAIRNSFPDFQTLNIRVFGVSADSVASHKKFAQKYQLSFTLLADEQKEVIQKYAVTGRTSFLIDPSGIIKKVYENVKPETHAADVLADIRKEHISL